jgi:hypothetical protein
MPITEAARPSSPMMGFGFESHSRRECVYVCVFICVCSMCVYLCLCVYMRARVCVCVCARVALLHSSVCVVLCVVSGLATG